MRVGTTTTTEISWSPEMGTNLSSDHYPTKYSYIPDSQLKVVYVIPWYQVLGGLLLISGSTYSITEIFIYLLR